MAGFYGKLPMRGDFISRDADEAFVERWDAWTREGLLAAQDALGPQWVDAYLSAPMWRFALPAGVCGPSALIGAWMASVDAAGRYFPLALIAPHARTDSPLAWIAQADLWFDAAEGVLLSALAEGADFDAFAQAAQAVAPPFEASDARGLRAAALVCALAPSGAAAHDESVWFKPGPPAPPVLQCAAGLDPDLFVRVLDAPAPAYDGPESIDRVQDETGAS